MDPNTLAIGVARNDIASVTVRQCPGTNSKGIQDGRSPAQIIVWKHWLSELQVVCDLLAATGEELSSLRVLDLNFLKKDCGFKAALNGSRSHKVLHATALRVCVDPLTRLCVVFVFRKQTHTHTHNTQTSHTHTYT